MRPGKRRALNKQTELGALLDKAKKLKASVRTKGEHSFRAINCQFGFAHVRYKRLAKNTAQLITVRALRNLRAPRRQLITERYTGMGAHAVQASARQPSERAANQGHTRRKSV